MILNFFCRLIPTLPLRINYLLWIEDLLKLVCPSVPPDNFIGIDVGAGASCIYAILGRFVPRFFRRGFVRLLVSRSVIRELNCHWYFRAEIEQKILANIKLCHWNYDSELRRFRGKYLNRSPERIYLNSTRLVSLSYHFFGNDPILHHRNSSIKIASILQSLQSLVNSLPIQ